MDRNKEAVVTIPEQTQKQEALTGQWCREGGCQGSGQGLLPCSPLWCLDKYILGDTPLLSHILQRTTTQFHPYLTKEKRSTVISWGSPLLLFLLNDFNEFSFSKIYPILYYWLKKTVDFKMKRCDLRMTVSNIHLSRSSLRAFSFLRWIHRGFSQRAPDVSMGCTSK